MTATRGERIHNPGNIKLGDDWQGLASEQVDPDFCSFQSAEYGVRAMCKILLAYQERHDVHTLAGIVERWAPPGENDTGAYIRDVCQRCELEPDAAIDLHDPAVMERVIRALICHENGRCEIPDAAIRIGMELAGLGPAKES